MIRNYFKTAWRNLLKDKLHSFINIAGLSIGIAVAVLIGLWLYDELSFDKNFDNYSQIARVQQNLVNNGEMQTWDNTPFPLAEVLRKDYGNHFSGIAMAAGLQQDHLLSFNDKKLKQYGAFFEEEAPDMFSLRMIQGSRQSLHDPSAILISASSAKAFFGTGNPLNKILKVDDLPPLKVAGVYQDFPRNSTFADLNFMGSWNFFYNNTDWVKNADDRWRPNFVMLFVELHPGEDFASVSHDIKDAKLRNINSDLQKKKPQLFLQPMSKWHLYAEFKNGVNTGGAIQYVWMFGIVGVFVLLLACINFMNLSTARSEKRAKEVGIRKTVGSLRSQLVAQFFAESFITVLIAFVIALLLVQSALPSFNTVADKHLGILWSNPVFWLISVAFILFTTAVAGSYPAFYLSSFRPVKVLKGTYKEGNATAIPRKVLVVMQFTVSVALIVATIIVYQQIQFAKDRPAGYSRGGLVSVPVAGMAVHTHFDAVKNELSKRGIIASIAEAGAPVTNLWNTTSGVSWQGKDPNLSVDFGVVNASVDYGKTIGWQIKEGRGFSKDFPSDSTALVLNEAAVHFMNLKHPVGETIDWFGDKMMVIGVVKDMIATSPYDVQKPILYHELNSKGNFVVMKLSNGISASTAVSGIESVFKSFNPGQPFEYSFVDSDYAKKFGDEERVGKIAGFFATLAIFISCLGLFGLTSFVAEQRKKEIGVRKVLGASVLNVWNLLSKEFIILITVAFLIAVPLSYYVMYSWLQHYTYRTTLSAWIFIVSGLGALAVTLVTVSIQAVKAALANPVTSLRSE